MRTPPKSVIHINFLSEVLLFDPRRVWTALRRAEESGKISPSVREKVNKNLGQTAVCLAQRDYLLRTAVEELKESLKALVDRIPERWKIPEVDDGGVRYRTVSGRELFKDRDKTLLAVDALLFELRAYLELLAKFVFGIMRGVGRVPKTQAKLTSGKSVTLADRKGRLRPHDFLLYLCDHLSVGIDWFEFLTEHRNFFTHESAPYIAIEDMGCRPPEFEFIIMRVNVHDFAAADPGDYFRLSEFTDVIKGVRNLAQKAQQNFVQMLES